MAKKVREGVKIIFTDGKTKEIFPVSVKKLRKVMGTLSGIDMLAPTLTNETIDSLLEANRIILEDYYPDTVEESYKVVAEREELVENGKEGYDLDDPLEEMLDVSTMNQVIAAGMGSDPNA